MSRFNISYGLEEDKRVISLKKVFELVKSFIPDEVYEPFVVEDEDDKIGIALSGRPSRQKLASGERGYTDVSFEVNDDQYGEVKSLLKAQGYIIGSPQEMVHSGHTPSWEYDRAPR